MIKFIIRVLNEIKGLLLLLATLLLSAAHTLIKDRFVASDYFPDKDPRTTPYFPGSIVELTADTYRFFWMMHVIFILLALYIFFEVRKHRNALLIFVLIQLVDLIDYLLNYGETWFFIDSFPISFNVMKVVFFLIAIANEVFLILERKWMRS